MKQKILLLSFLSMVMLDIHAQKKQKLASTTGYAITADEKGGRSWREVRLVDLATGEEVKTIYESKSEPEVLNARTGKPVKKDPVNPGGTLTTTFINGDVQTKAFSLDEKKRIVNLDQTLEQASASKHAIREIRVIKHIVAEDKPFSTNSAAMAYDGKHSRLYYTPMGINQLRYIDIKSGKVYFFEDEAFGTVKNSGDAANQITRMVVASDGNGYALTNSANHLIQFTTGKKPIITDLGPVTDENANSKYSIHNGGGYGGDMIADASGNLYLLTANRNVFKINIESRVASHKGVITGLPRDFSTNGAMVEEGSKILVASSESTVGYFRVDLNTLKAEKISSGTDVFNASDLANGNLAFDKKKKEKKADEVKPVVADVTQVQKSDISETIQKNAIAVYPNPVTDGFVKLSFSNQPAGRYQVQLLDVSGRLISTKEVNINGPAQIEEFRFPELSVKGTYLVNVTNAAGKINTTTKIVVQ